MAASGSADAPGMVRLISAEGFDFYVDREAACVSNTIKSMLNSEGEGAARRCLPAAAAWARERAAS